MKQISPAFALLSLLAACGGGELSSLELGGDGARLSGGQARTPLEAYDQAYASFSRQHLNVRRNLDQRTQNHFAAREAFESILKHLKTMHALAVPADQPKIEPYLAKYAEFLKECERGTWGGSWNGHLDIAERDAKSRLHPNQIAVIEVWAGAPPAAAPPAPAPPAGPAAKPSGEIPADKIEVPAAKTAPAAPSGAAKPPPPAVPGPAPALPVRLVYKAWDRAHDDLVAAYLAKKDCRQAYDDVVQALRALKDAVAPDKAPKLQIYLDYYADVQQKTKGFSVLPEKTTEKDVADELAVAARVIRKDYNPDR